MRRPLIVGNWKMNGTTASLDEAVAIAADAAGLPAIDAALCPPATLIAAMVARVGSLPVGGQDCHAEGAGAFTGSIAADMLVDAGARWVIVGHSERRGAFSETDALVKAKAEAALAAGLSVIVCVGEPLAVREADEAESHVLTQVAGSLPGGDATRIALAYEPIWAIGTGRTATPDDVQAMHGAIRSALSDRIGADADVVRLLYGGSVTGDTAPALLSLPDVDGALVGGASLTAAKFGPILDAAARL